METDRMIDKVRRLLDATPFVPFKLRAYDQDYLVPGPYEAKYDLPTGYLVIFLDDDNHTLVHGDDVVSVTELPD